MICLVAGDSIAVDVATRFPQCQVDAKIGVGSANIIGRVKNRDVVVISAGSNDPDNPKLVSNLERMRAKVTGTVIWIAPVDATAYLAVWTVAKRHGDKVVSFVPGRDHVHPKNLSPLVEQIKKAWPS